MRVRARKWMVALMAWTMVAAIALPAMASEITWKATIWGPKRASAQALEWYAKEVAAKTGGQMKLEFAYEQGKATEALDALKTHEMSYVCVQYHADKMPLLTVIELPMFAPDSPSVLGRVELALVDHPTVQAELKKLNMKILIPVALPPYQLMSTRRIAKVDDLQGVRVRMSADMGRILEEYGASSKVMPVPEAITAMKSGGLDAIALPPYAFVSYKVQETAKYMTDKISLGSPLCALAVNQKAWDALPPKVQEVMTSLRQPAVALYEDIFAREDAANLAAFKSANVEISNFSAADRARLVAKSIKAWQAWVEEREKQGLKGREVFEFVQTKIREFSRR